ncbi:2-C-methyl-D-erythritol 2,4-cyclodiphosphate synthase [Petrimonas sp.]|uniref:2-C-methyl-D-erythritol 2,4-cyclodiphosphate synthase n=1 Tax=Petrimonas sp. TaxID=2023866 RepID=UPI003F51821D
MQNSAANIHNSQSSKSPLGDLGVFRIGFGYDMHRLTEGRDFWMGGIKIDFEKGLQGHSDADVLIHAVCDALLGAANLRDIGFHFPDTAGEFHNIDSKILLRKTVALLRDKGFEIGNIDATICAEAPKMNPHIPAMQQTLSEIIQTDIDNISIKATTSEKMGFVGRQEGITAYAVALVYKQIGG